MNGKYSRLPASIYLYDLWDKMARHSFVPLLGDAARARYNEWSWNVVLWFLKKALTRELERYMPMPLLPVSADGRINPPSAVPRTIWTLWWQGDDALSNLPQGVAVCLKTLRGQKSFSTVVITKENVGDYIDLSDVLPLFNEGRIKVQCLSDIIRARLLRTYGGVWCDMGILFLDPACLSELAVRFSFFSIKKRDTAKRNVARSLWSSYFWITYPNSPVMGFLDEAMTAFILKYGTNFRFFLIDFILMLEYREVPAARQLLDSLPASNPDVFWLKERLLDEAAPYIESGEMESALAGTRIFKLSSAQLRAADAASEGSVWKEIEKKVALSFNQD